MALRPRGPPEIGERIPSRDRQGAVRQLSIERVALSNIFPVPDRYTTQPPRSTSNSRKMDL